MGQFSKAFAKSIIRHWSGTYYLSAKVDGKKVREALETKNPNVAKLKRDDRLKASRAAAKKEQAKTVGDLLAFDLRRVSSRSA